MWGEPHARVNGDTVARTLDEMLAINASVNIYVFHGGTSFGFTSGNDSSTIRLFHPSVTTKRKLF